MAEELLNQIKAYWSTRPEGYSEVNEKELAGEQKRAWLSVLEEHFPAGEKREMKILDVGTGPGFFPVILARAGYAVTAVDYTPGMLKKAGENLKKYAGDRVGEVTLLRMDAQDLSFADETFDVVLSRNLTWNLENPEQAYREWYRVLKPGGILLNFDANWYGYLYDGEKRKAYEQDRVNVEKSALEDHYLCTDIDAMEKIALQVPLSRIGRPDWDRRVLEETGFQGIRTDEDIWQRLWSKEEKLNYGSTPLFLICAGKGEE